MSQLVEVHLERYNNYLVIKYPKTDYTYSTVSKDRVELAPGQIAVPNMSRRSLKHFRIYGPNTSLDEVDEMMIKDNTWFTGTTRKRLVAAESSDDEDASYSRQLAEKNNQWWITSVLTTLMSIIVTTTQSTYRSVFGSTKGYPYTNLPPRKTSALHSTASALAAPFVWIYTKIVSTITTTITTITETITPNSELRHYTPAFAVVTKERKRRWWPWLMLLLILPIIGYGYYNYPEIMALVENEKEDVTSPAHFQPKVKTDIGLTNRLAALEKWAGTIDAKMKVFEEKISNFDNLDARIEAYSIKYLQQNVIQILSENSKILADKLKLHFENDFMSKNEMERIKIEIYEKLMASWKPEMTEDSIRKIIQEHLAIFEKRQMQTLVERIKEYMKQVKVQKIETGFDEERVKKIVAAILEVYDADKTGLVDYALESAGGQILSTRCTELYQIKTKQYSLLGVPVWWVYTSPRYALTPGAMPAECWAFQGFPGYLVVKTYAVIEVTSFSIEHMSKLLAVDGKIESAPKNFSVYGLHDELDTNPHLFGDYMYDENGTSIQYFPVKYPKTQNIGGIDYPVAFDIIELRIETNYGNPTYTCVYRFRVHGNPLTDIRRATEDSIYDSKV